MYVKLVMTDGGPHSPETLSGMAVQRFLDDFEANAPSAAFGEVARLRVELDKILTEHHRRVQEVERLALREAGPERLLDDIDHREASERAVDDVIAVVTAPVPSGSAPKWQSLVEYFRRPETRQYFLEVLHRELHHNTWIERSWHAQGHTIAADGSVALDDRLEEKDHPAALAFRAVETHGHAILTWPHPDDAELPEHESKHLSLLEVHGGRDAVVAVVAASIPHLRPERPAEGS